MENRSNVFSSLVIVPKKLGGTRPYTHGRHLGQLFITHTHREAKPLCKATRSTTLASMWKTSISESDNILLHNYPNLANCFPILDFSCKRCRCGCPLARSLSPPPHKKTQDPTVQPRRNRDKMDLLLPSLGVRGYRRPFAFRVHIVNVRRLRYFGGTAGQTGSRTSQSSSRVKNSCYFGLANLSRDCLLCEHFAPEISQTDTHTHRVVVVVSRSEGSVTRDATHFLTHGRDAYTHTQTHPTLRHIYTDTHTRKRMAHSISVFRETG